MGWEFGAASRHQEKGPVLLLVTLQVKVESMLKRDAYCNTKHAHNPICLEVSKPATVKVIQSHTGSITTDAGKPPPGTVRKFCDPSYLPPHCNYIIYLSLILYVHTC